MSDIRDSRINGASMDIEQSEKDKLQAVFPQCFEEGKLNIDRLLNLCGEYITNDFEKFTFQWKGKVEALQMAQNPSMGTLRPCEEDSVDWENTENLYFEGDNLEVLKLLQKTYFRKVKMIYIDPPYNTGNDFIYKDDFKDPMNRYKEVTKQTTKSNPESMGRFHTNWLSMMYPRLRLAVNLLRDDGVIFISIDDHEVHHLRKLCDQVFGEENFVAQFTWKKRSGANDAKNNVSIDHEYIICYSKTFTNSLNGVKKEFENYSNPDNDPRGIWAKDNLTCGKTASQRPNLYYPIIDPTTDIEYPCNPNHVWRFGKSKMKELINLGKIIFPKDGKGLPAYKRHKQEIRSETKPFSSIIDTRLNSIATKEIRNIMDGQIFDYPKTIDLLKQLINQGSNEDSIILDFFSGSATTAHAVMQLNAEELAAKTSEVDEDGNPIIVGNRKFIMVQLPELCDEKSEAYKAGYKNICEIGKERIRRAGTKIKAEYDEKQAEKDTNQTSLLEFESLELDEENSEQKPLDTGFRVFKLDTSNMIHWDNSYIKPQDVDILLERMNNMFERVKPERGNLDVVYEIMLKIGIPLTETVTAIDFDGITAYSIYEDCLVLVCFEENVAIETVEKMAELEPARMIFGQKSFPDLTAMSNAKLSLRQRNIDLQYV